jgi:hypothetical protein
LLTFAVPCLAQQSLPDPATNRPTDDAEAERLEKAWLHSGDSHQIAWAAELIARDDRRGLIPDLIEQLKPFPSSLIGTALQAIADSLIRLHAEVPAERVMYLPSTWTAEQMILLTWSPDNRPTLLKIFENSEMPVVWLAAANLLAEKPQSDFVKSLLKSFRVVARFRVTVPGKWLRDDQEHYGQSITYAYGPPDSAGPPTAKYGLSLTKGTVFAPGAHPVRYYTYEILGEIPWYYLLPHVSATDFIPGLLAQMAQIPEKELRLSAEVREDIVYRGPDEYLGKIKAILSPLDEDFARILRSYVQLGLLTAAEAKSVKLPVDLTISDLRTSRIAPLPPPPKFQFLALKR